MAATKKTVENRENAQVLDNVVDAPKAEEVNAEESAEKTVKKAAKETVKKTRATKAVKAAKTAEETTAEEKAEKPAAKRGRKPAAKKSELVASISVQFAGKSYTNEDLIQIAKDVWHYDLDRDEKDLQTVELYVKTEESAVYYVFNGTEGGSFAI